ncbi:MULTISPECIES: MarR family transcriptional regulator [Flavobacterium]|mgnify:FL=1|uniref:MarR family winged helix-turn-helix transcriptional regulator n=1 Tax=Flavobacterium TaxID=237 RepID=UPI00096020F3|nr:MULTISPECIES: MarR family transcriptional regulator [Flavobacterium]MBN9285670.1 MarR family transcriptional regulator [Flavobacterium sp.]OJV70562.1 MAG: MarR family transcriptional regulator [Flavobacterium sp. 40-81]
METIFTTENLYNILSGRIQSAFNRALLNNFKANNIGLTKEKWSILAVLWKNDGCSQQVLADETYRDKPSITRLVDNLEKEGLVTRKPDAKDRRLNLIFLTDKGKSIENTVMKVVDATVNEAVKGIDPDELRIVRETFLKIYDNLEIKK